MFKQGEDADNWIPVDVSFIKEFWLPDAEILNLKEFKTLDVLSKLEGLWLNRKFEIMYAVATRITYICPMTFNSFPLDVQVSVRFVSPEEDKDDLGKRRDIHCEIRERDLCSSLDDIFFFFLSFVIPYVGSSGTNTIAAFSSLVPSCLMRRVMTL